MINDHIKEKITRFLNDEVMSSAVYDVLRETFLKTRHTKSEYPEVMFLAAERIAADLLVEGWKELKKLKLEKEKVESEAENIGK